MSSQAQIFLDTFVLMNLEDGWRHGWKLKELVFEDNSKVVWKNNWWRVQDETNPRASRDYTVDGER